MKIGCCTSLFGEDILRLNETGADYAEIGLSELANHSKDEVAERAAALDRLGVRCLAGNVLFPGTILLTGETVDLDAVRRYLADVLDKAALLGLETVVFGSSGSRRVPEGFDHRAATEQLKALCADVIAPAVAERGMVCCVEPLRHPECNILNTCAETSVLVREVDDPRIRLLVDLYHFDSEGEERSTLANYRGMLGHAHIASAKNARAIPQRGDGENYREFFDALTAANYDGKLSVEGVVPDRFIERVRSSIEYLREFI